MQKITNEEIANLKTDAKLLYKIPSSLLPTYRIIELERALDRLTELEAQPSRAQIAREFFEEMCKIRPNTEGLMQNAKTILQEWEVVEEENEAH